MTPTVPSGFAVLRGFSTPRLHWSSSPAPQRIRSGDGRTGCAAERIRAKKTAANAGSALPLLAVSDTEPTQIPALVSVDPSSGLFVPLAVGGASGVRLSGGTNELSNTSGGDLP